MGLKDSFIRRGYVPAEFIPPFKSESLADALQLLPRDVLAYGTSGKNSGTDGTFPDFLE
jgi:hypothetical protein